MKRKIRELTGSRSERLAVRRPRRKTLTCSERRFPLRCPKNKE